MSKHKPLPIEHDPSASPAAILACIQLLALLVRIAIALYKAQSPEAGRAHAAELLSREWDERQMDRSSWRDRVSLEDRLRWDQRGPRWRAVRILRALGEEVKD